MTRVPRDHDLHDLPVDPDLEPGPTDGARRLCSELDLLALIAIGGAVGAIARWALIEVWGHSDLPWAVLVVNTAGCAAIGVLMALLLDLTSPGSRTAQRVRALIGVGFLGGFTTFSTAMLDLHGLLVDGRLPAAVGVMLLGLLTALAAVLVGLLGTRRLLQVLVAARREV